MIDELYIGGFGRWRDTTITFAPGLNLFTAPNEAGKTTLLHAIFAALYGMKRDYLRTTRYLEEYERYYPWQPVPYETVIRYQLAGQSFRLYRCHDKEREQARLYREPELTEITRLYQEDRRKEYNFLERHLGLTRTLFTDVTWVRGEPVQATRQLLPSLVRDSAADPLIDALLNALEQELNSIGRKEGAAHTILGKLSRQLEEAQRVLSRAEEEWRAVQELSQSLAVWQAERHALEAERKKIEADLERLSQAETAWQADWQRSYAVATAAELAAWAESAATDAERELHQQTAADLAQVEREMAVLREQTAAEIEVSTRDPAVRWLSFAEIDDLVWQQWWQDWYALSAYKRREQESEPLIDVDKLQADFRIGQEWTKELERLQRECERLAAQIAETKQTYEKAGGHPTGPVPQRPQLSGEHDVPRRRQRNRRTGMGQAVKHSWGWYAAALLAAGSSLFYAWGGEGTAALLLAMFAAAAVSFGAYRTRRGLQFARKHTGAMPPSELLVSHLQARLAELEQALSAKQKERDKLEAALGKLLAEWEVADWETFLSMREKWLYRILQHQANEKEARERQRLQLRLEKQMLEWGVPPHLSFEEAAALVLRERAEWEQRSRAEQERLRNAMDRQKEQALVAQRLKQLEQQRAELLNGWGIAVREILLRRKQELTQKRQKAEAERTRREEALIALREQIAQARGEIGQRGEGAWAKAKSYYDEVKGKWEEVRLRRDALSLAQALLQEAMEEWRIDLAPRLSQEASTISRRLTKGRYPDVRIDPLQEFAIRVVEPERRDAVEHHRFSSGTQDQLYFSQRIALLKAVSAEREPLPVFFDDHFLHYDQERLEAALDYLMELAEVHQVLVFSCHRREHDYLQPRISGSTRHKLHSWPQATG